MGKDGRSWIRLLKKAIHEHIHGDIDENILRFPHLAYHKKSTTATMRRDPPVASTPKKTCTCSSNHTSASLQVSIVDGRSERSIDSSDSGGSSRSGRLSDCRSSTGSCSMNRANSRRIPPMGDRSPPTEEPRLQYEDESEADDRETIVTLVNLWGPQTHHA